MRCVGRQPDVLVAGAGVDRTEQALVRRDEHVAAGHLDAKDGRSGGHVLRDATPGRAVVDGAIHAGSVVPVEVGVGLAGADVDDVRAGRVDRDGADRQRRQPVALGKPGAAAVGSAPHATAGGADPDDVGVGRVNRQ